VALLPWTTILNYLFSRPMEMLNFLPMSLILLIILSICDPILKKSPSNTLARTSFHLGCFTTFIDYSCHSVLLQRVFSPMSSKGSSLESGHICVFAKFSGMISE